MNECRVQTVIKTGWEAAITCVEFISHCYGLIYCADIAIAGMVRSLFIVTTQENIFKPTRSRYGTVRPSTVEDTPAPIYQINGITECKARKALST